MEADTLSTAQIEKRKIEMIIGRLLLLIFRNIYDNGVWEMLIDPFLDKIHPFFIQVGAPEEGNFNTKKKAFKAHVDVISNVVLPSYLSNSIISPFWLKVTIVIWDMLYNSNLNFNYRLLIFM